MGVVSTLTRRSPRSLTGREADDIPIVPLPNIGNECQAINVYEQRKNQHMLELNEKKERERKNDDGKRAKYGNKRRASRGRQGNQNNHGYKNTSNNFNNEFDDPHFHYNDNQFYNNGNYTANPYNNGSFQPSAPLFTATQPMHQGN